ncbi:MAG: hypothetical protein ACYCV4_05450 [Dermatophilaceae bacterium]
MANNRERLTQGHPGPWGAPSQPGPWAGGPAVDPTAPNVGGPVPGGLTLVRENQGVTLVDPVVLDPITGAYGAAGGGVSTYGAVAGRLYAPMPGAAIS